MAQIKQFARDLAKHRVIAVDSSIFIYKFEQNSKFEGLCSVVFELLDEGSIELITSSVTASEILVRPFQLKDIETISLYESVLQQLPNFTLVNIDYPLAKLAAQLRAQYVILLPDALQLAAALMYKATLFVTNDRQLKKVKDIKVLYLGNYL